MQATTLITVNNLVITKSVTAITVHPGKLSLKLKIGNYVLKKKLLKTFKNSSKPIKWGVISFIFGSLGIIAFLLAFLPAVSALSAVSAATFLALLGITSAKIALRKNKNDKFAKVGRILSYAIDFSIIAIILVVLIAFVTNGK